MDSPKVGSRGFTLIASLLLLLILSGMSIGMLMMVNTEGLVGSHDEKNNLSFHAAEGGIEHMTSDLATLFQNIQAPSVSAIEGLSSLAPANTAFMSYPVYTLTPATNTDGSLATAFGQIASGPYQGLYAQILPISLQVTAMGPLGDEVNMSRTVEVALVPVFQFGIFSDSDLSFFAGPSLDFAGRVHTNGDLFLAEGNGSVLTFHDKVTAWGNVIRWELPNGNTDPNTNHQGDVDVPTASQGCDGGRPACRNMGVDLNNWTNEGSVTVGAAGNTWTTGGQNAGWPSVSVGTYHGWIADGNYGLSGGTGAKQLSLPFVSGTGNAANGPQAFEIIRRPPPGELSTSLLGSARLYNNAAIRVLLSDTPADLPGGTTDAQNIRLANFNDPTNGVNNQFGVWPTSVPTGTPPLGGGDSYSMYFATATTAVPDPTNWTGNKTTLLADWLYQPEPPLAGDVTLFDANAPIMAQNPAGDNHGLTTATQPITLSQCNSSNGSCGTAAPYPWYTPVAYPAPPLGNTTWNLLDGYLRVEYRDAAGVYHPITSEWLKLGFARNTLPPTGPGRGPGGNDVNPDAILILQKPADRNADGVIDPNGIAPSCVKVGGVWNCTSGKPPEVTKDVATNFYQYGDSTGPNGQSPTMYNWYPINFYDAREGETRDVVQGATCTPAGVVNAVELDVGNLQRWLNGNIAGSGNLVDFTAQNGYVLYFSDRRGMLPNPNGTQVDAPGTKTGDAGFEDTVNTASQVGTPDGGLQATPPGKNQSPEDDNNNGKLDNFGAGNLGLGLGSIPPLTYSAGNNVNRLVMANPAAPNPYLTAGRMPNCSVAQDNWVSGARHVLKLVDGSLGNVPVRPDNGKGGFTVGSENPVYILGDYNTSAADPTWANPNALEPAHAAAAVIADAVTLLSNNWSDLASLNSPSNDGGRLATTTYYRVAIAGGKNINFPVNLCCAGWAVGDWGTDGGLHNFLRQLEKWSGQVLNYKGSMVSMYYSTYATGTDKNGGGTVYEPATRNYIFDPLFTQPQNLPPGTPLFRDIDNLSYRQSFTPHTGCY